MKRAILKCILLTLMLIITGCSTSIPRDNIKLTPGKLFEGDAERLAPHFDMIPGCVKVNYKGNKKTIHVKYEIWEQGELKENNNAISASIKKGKFNGEVSISITKNHENEQHPNRLRMKTVIHDATGHVGTTQYINGFDSSMGYGGVELQESKLVKDNEEEVVIWGLAAYEEAYKMNQDDIKEQIKNADWGLLLKLSLGSEEKEDTL